MNKEEIMKKVEEILGEKSGDKTGGSGHLSSVFISDIKIEKITEKVDTYEVQVTYNMDILSEFDVAEEPDPNKETSFDDPYHYMKSETLIIKK